MRLEIEITLTLHLIREQGFTGSLKPFASIHERSFQRKSTLKVIMTGRAQVWSSAGTISAPRMPALLRQSTAESSKGRGRGRSPRNRRKTDAVEISEGEQEARIICSGF